MTLLALLCLGLLAPPDVDAQPYVRDDRRAIAEWIVPMKDESKAKWYLIEVAVRQPVGGDTAPTMATVVRGSCDVDQDSYSCSGRGARTEIDAAAFEMAVDMSSASVGFRYRRKVYEAAWTETHPIPGSYQAWEGCFDAEGEEGQGEGGGLLKSAPAAGKFAGRDLKPDPESFSMLLRGVMVTECEPFARVVELGNGRIYVTRADLSPAFPEVYKGPF